MEEFIKEKVDKVLCDLETLFEQARKSAEKTQPGMDPNPFIVGYTEQGVKDIAIELRVWLGIKK